MALVRDLATSFKPHGSIVFGTRPGLQQVYSTMPTETEEGICATLFIKARMAFTMDDQF